MRIVVILLIMLLAAATWADGILSDVGDLQWATRTTSGLYSTTSLPDSVNRDISYRALRFTSENIGGVWMRHQVISANGQRFYAIPDTIVNVVFGMLPIGNKVKFLPVFDPRMQLVQEELAGEGEYAKPNYVLYWNDTIQIIPTPISVDTLSLWCFVKHPVCDTCTNDTLDIEFSSGYIEAAVEYAAHLAHLSLKNHNAAMFHLELYKQKAAAAAAAYRRFNEAPSEN